MKYKEYVNHMPGTFTEALMAIIFFLGSYRGSYHGSLVSWENILVCSLFKIYCLLPLKLP